MFWVFCTKISIILYDSKSKTETYFVMNQTELISLIISQPENSLRALSQLIGRIKISIYPHFQPCKQVEININWDRKTCNGYFHN